MKTGTYFTAGMLYLNKKILMKKKILKKDKLRQ